MITSKENSVGGFIHKRAIPSARRRLLSYRSYYIISYIILRIDKIRLLKIIDDAQSIEDYLRTTRNVSEQPEGSLLVHRNQSLRLATIK